MPYSEIRPEDPSLIDEMAEAAERFPGRLLPFARMHPSGGEAGVALFESAVRERGHRGLKFHPVGSMVHPADPGHVAFTRKAAELGVPVLFHCGDEEYTLPWQIARLLEAVPEATIILGHMGGYSHVPDAIEVAERYPNAILETSACPHPGLIREAIARVGPDRVVFGSDGPGCLPALEVKKIRDLGLPEAVERKVLHDTMARLLGLEEGAT